jgi:hypothetical protein
MVTRTRIEDNRYTYTDSYGNISANAGMYYKKDQAGGDYAVRPKRPKYFPKKKFHFSENHQYALTMLATVQNPVEHKLPMTKPVSDWALPITLAGGAPNTIPVWSSNDELNLINKLSNEIRGSDFNLAVTLAQTGEALDMLTQSATQIYRALHAVRRGDIKGVFHALNLDGQTSKTRHKPFPPPASTREFTSRWLEYQYGWAPLVGDTYDAMKLMAKQIADPAVKRYRVRVKRTNSVYSPVGTWGWKQVRAVRKEQLIALVSEQPTSADISGMTDPASVAWEILPYSFVIDWFLPVGNYLQARAAVSSLKGRVTFIRTTMTERQCRGIRALIPSAIVFDGDDACHLHEIFLTRSISTTLKVPLPSIVSFSEALGWKRAVNALSLLNNFKLHF